MLSTEGTLNTREVAAYRTAEGYRLRSGLLYRSSALTYATRSDLRLLQSRQITTVIDFRGPAEAREAPDRVPVGARYVPSPVSEDDLDYPRIDEMLKRQGFSSDMRDTALVNSYGPFYRMYTLVNSYGNPAFVPKLEAYRALFDTLLDPSHTGAVLMHCTGGRDRTGIGTAILLRALNVPMAQIQRDYLASNLLLQPDRTDPASTAFERFDFSSVYLQPPQNDVYQRAGRALHERPTRLYDTVKLKSRYLLYLFATITQVDGSFTDFLDRRLGMTSQRINDLKSRMLV